MIYHDLRTFINDLSQKKLLVTIQQPVDPNQEITILQHRMLSCQGPALLFENIKGFPGKRLVSNLFGTQQRVSMVFGNDPSRIGTLLTQVATEFMPPSLSLAWKKLPTLKRLFAGRLKKVNSGPIMDTVSEPPCLDQLPCLTCWPLDGGPFFTLPLVHTRDPVTGIGNLGIYRMQLYDSSSTGMHWQIEKGGGNHFKKACELNQILPLSVFLGGPPALLIAAVAPLPEGIDERLLAGLIMGKPLDVILRKQTHHLIPAHAEFVLEGYVKPNDTRKEGPFGDHLGHYSYSSQFPIFHCQRLLCRKNAIFPATVVGKPPQEDYYIGTALQEMTLPLLKLLFPGIHDLWAYPETGFHPLAVASVEERYMHEALKYACALLGHGQLSLTKVLIIVRSGDVINIRDFKQVSTALFQHLDIYRGMHLLAPTSQDTLDFTGPSMNTGSKLICLATHKEKIIRTIPNMIFDRPSEIHTSIMAATPFGEAFLIVKLSTTTAKTHVMQTLRENPLTRDYLFHILVSDDVDIHEMRMILWGWFTRFDPQHDLFASSTDIRENKLVFQCPLCIDATWKQGYRQPVAFDPTIEKRVNEHWYSFFKKVGAV